MGVIPALEPYAEGFAVATPGEAAALRKRTDKPITVLCCGAYQRIRNTAFSVGSPADAFDIPGGVKAAVKVNTGMNRIGCTKETLPDVLRILAKRRIEIDSVYTHFYDACDRISAQEQFSRFEAWTSGLSVRRHCCASSCLTVDDGAYYLDAVRPGLALYGYGEGMTPAMTVTAPVISIGRVKKGEHIGYGTRTAGRDMRVATVRFGYADGFRRTILPVYVEAEKKLCRVEGSVCMDMFMFDASFTGVKEGDEVTILGGKAVMGNLCRAYRTIEYEVLTGFDRARVAKKYIGG